MMFIEVEKKLGKVFLLFKEKKNLDIFILHLLQKSAMNKS